MQKKTYNEADLTDLFGFAKENYGLHWNACCDLFEGTGILHGQYRDFYLYEVKQASLQVLEKDVKNPAMVAGTSQPLFPDRDKKIKAYRILVAFMEKHKAKTMRLMCN